MLKLTFFASFNAVDIGQCVSGANRQRTLARGSFNRVQKKECLLLRSVCGMKFMDTMSFSADSHRLCSNVYFIVIRCIKCVSVSQMAKRKMFSAMRAHQHPWMVFNKIKLHVRIDNNCGNKSACRLLFIFARRYFISFSPDRWYL